MSREALSQVLLAVARLSLEHPEIKEIDINPLMVSGADPVAVDALIVVA